MSELAVHLSNAGEQAYSTTAIDRGHCQKLASAGRAVGLVTSDMTTVEASVGRRAEAPSLWCKQVVYPSKDYGQPFVGCGLLYRFRKLCPDFNPESRELRRTYVADRQERLSCGCLMQMTSRSYALFVSIELTFSHA